MTLSFCIQINCCYSLLTPVLASCPPCLPLGSSCDCRNRAWAVLPAGDVGRWDLLCYSQNTPWWAWECFFLLPGQALNSGTWLSCFLVKTPVYMFRSLPSASDTKGVIPTAPPHIPTSGFKIICVSETLAALSPHRREPGFPSPEL